MLTAVLAGVADCVAGSVRSVIPEPTEWQRIGNQIDAVMIIAGAVCRKWRHFLCYRISDGIHIALQIAQSLPPDLSHSAAKGVPSPARKSRSASTPCHASPVRFVSPAFPLA